MGFTDYKILITGGAGYIGNVLVDCLYESNLPGVQVTVLDNLVYRQRPPMQWFNRPGFRFVLGDVRDYDLMKTEVKKADIVIHLAALVGMPACKKNEYDTKTINLDATRQLVKLVSPSQQLIYPNTNSGYGIGGESYCTEQSPLNPISLYGTTKCDAETAILGNDNGISFRLATVFGLSNRMRLDLLVNDFTYRAYTDGTIMLFESHFKRNFVHVRDVCNAFIFGIKNYTKMSGQAYNVGLSSANLSKYELCERIKNHIPNFVIKEADFGEDPDKRDYIVSNEKLESLGWSCNYGLDKGIDELISGYNVLCYNKEFTNV